jgi:microcystin degradation protein MlrC
VSMRVAIAQFSQETDTFNPVPSEVSCFQAFRLQFGRDVLETTGGNDAVDGALQFFKEKAEVDLVPVLSAKAVPGGKLKEEALCYFSERIVEGLRSQLPVDAVLLSLHGATVSEQTDDVCGRILEDVRSLVGPGVPVVVPLDHHANITRRIVEHATLAVGHETQPHDQAATGRKAAKLLLGLLQHNPRITGAWAKIPMTAPQEQFATSCGPMKRWFDEARTQEHRSGVLSVSPFPVQPWIDVDEVGWSVVVYTDGDAELAASITRTLAQQAWDAREEFWVSHRVPPAEAVRRAVTAKEGLVVLSDTGDAVYGGSPGDSTCLLGEMVRQHIPCQAFVPLVDSRAVERAFEIGLGHASMVVGGRHDPFSRPIGLSGRISALSRGLKLVLPAGAVEVGPCALLEVENVKVVLMAESGHAINHPILYSHLGLRIENARIVVLKTGGNFQYFDPWRKELIRADTPGTTQSDLTTLPWQKLPRPIYPLDRIAEWRAGAMCIG